LWNRQVLTKEREDEEIVSAEAGLAKDNVEVQKLMIFVITAIKLVIGKFGSFLRRDSRFCCEVVR